MSTASTPNSEFVIWGKAPGSKQETLLVSEYAGIRDEGHAREIIAKLHKDHDCKDLRFQRLSPLGDAADLAAMFRGALAQ